MRAALLAAALAAAGPADAATFAGGDYAGADLSPANNDILSGTFTNVGLFSLPAGATVFVAAGVPLSVYAATASIAGTLDGGGRGQLGGSGGNVSGVGSAGFNGGPTGAGAAGAAADGGGGGAYGGAGGAGSGPSAGAGGAVYDSTGVYTSPLSADDIFQGSGGGGGGGSNVIEGGAGSSGGAAVYIEAASMTLTGTILLQGATAAPVTSGGANPGGGGGGSGGGLLLRITGALEISGGRVQAYGGRGGWIADGDGCATAPAGGGGGGGRIKLFAKNASYASVTLSTAAGPAGGKDCGGFDVPAPANGSAGTVSFGTVASSPTAFAVLTVYVTSISWTWNATASFGDAPPASQAYRLYPSTSTAPLGAPELAPLTAGATTTGLTPNTTYSRFVTAFTDWGNSAPSTVVSTHTLASPPAAAGAPFSAMASNGLTFNWDAGTPANPVHTLYEVNAALDAAFSAGVSTSFIVGVSSTPSGLAANTTYWLRVRAINIDNVPTSYAAALATATLAVAPASPAVGTVYVTSAAFAWSGGVNPAGTQYVAEVSDDNFFTVLGTSSTLSASATFFGLTPGEQYFFRVKAVNRNSVPSAYSASVSTFAGNLADVSPPSAPGTPAGDRAFSYDGTVFYTWTPATSGVGILDYELLLGSTPGGNDVFNGAVAVSCYTATGLATGRSYFAQVRARSNAGVVGPFSGVSVGVPVFLPAQSAPIPKPKAWPNPANPAQGPVQIGFFLEEPADVTMRVYTLQGRLLSETTRRYDTAGNQIGSWDGTGGGGRVAPGGYVVEIRKRYSGRVDSQRVKVAILY